MARILVPLYFIAAVAVSFTAWWNLPALGDLGKQMREAGPLVARPTAPPTPIPRGR